MAQSDGTTTEYFAYDGLGSVRQLVDEAGSVTLAQTFDAYGNGYAKAGSAESSFGYSGEQTDANGFVYLRARYYAPGMGRFFQRDIWRGDHQRPQSLNAYMYAEGNVTLYTDPTGQFPIPAITPDYFIAVAALRIMDTYHRHDTSVEALAQLFVYPWLDKHSAVTGSTVSGRLEFILTTVSGNALGIPLGPTATPLDGKGLKTELDDGTKNQMNHFLTAVKIGYDPNVLNAPLGDVVILVPGGHVTVTIRVRDVLGISPGDDTDCAAVKLIMGHELLPDDIEWPDPAAWRQQYQATKTKHVQLFLQAVAADDRHENMDQYLAQIFKDGVSEGHNYDPDDPKCQIAPGADGSLCLWGKGNSMHDLRLTVKGYRFGRDIQARTIVTRSRAADWLRLELGY